MNEVYLSLGSNLGDRKAQLQEAVRLLQTNPSISNIKMSSIYETAPVGYLDQHAFLNLVIRLETSLSPLELLDICQEIEQALHRERLVRWGPRTVDLDVLLYGQEQVATERLTIPHPRMYERAFVLVPLQELMPSLILPEDLEMQEVHVWKTYNDVNTFLRDAN
ncbi:MULTISPECIES: 2-amino-4-hydroxy-6-hydroxymethyldihydropteridine diphosphokinase [unclassified Planococcus (in: firmicutes)]|uniref:2-amino-4-hydroxy-6- hydroxymethyldihydropteridine diphosphokinase n=1 Tax=Planococcus TaxID=1372 RepID=UPI000C3452C8|nr:MULTISPECIES: 2-amino-4-hydroxy-6-hydroxymethyldihydropteridine diphosphokinase [unclassified Planococcus (in: firmicutes)]AUD12576.1 2-amino-4-hydroxy-6-hydroxymethyldihydropteridine diphosphokinase [Planococcus sp. MB-3u-03]PKG44403.1 2-amino-4-hydroxy-6-hydroxymethyldihydropteridine diphosphokinase [Planococcus sp. Urea-trap-24]PKG91216.1 2-amino-4-hydroxy-6-hydroxymethyldihydropteridine diphosphokinase [Planococcus sp. Urea-3u-39]PKH39555.1 2-amino-4-hydroxy-6-hydroxymethyldihydropteridi